MKKEKLFLILILIVGSFLRFYKLSKLAVFIGDQGRDYLAAKEILTGRKSALFGPQTSIPWIYLGPFFYYFLAFFLWLGKFNPIWPVYGTAFFGVLAIYLIYILGKKLFSEKVGLLSALFYAISPFAVLQSRISLHPSILPIFVIIFLVFLVDLTRSAKLFHSRGVMRGGIMLGAFLIAVQLHLSAILLLPIAAICLEREKFGSIRIFKLFILVSLGFLIFKLYRNSPLTPISYWWKMFAEIFSYGGIFGSFIALFLTMTGLVFLISQKKRGERILLFSLGVILIGLTIKNSQAEHYFNLFLPVVILVFAYGLAQSSKLKLGNIVIRLVALFFLFTNYYLLITSNYFSKVYGPGLEARIKLAKFIVDDAGEGEFGLKRCGPLWDYPSTNNNYEYLIWWLSGEYRTKQESSLAGYPIYIIYEPVSSIEESEVCEKYFGIEESGERIFESEFATIVRIN